MDQRTKKRKYHETGKKSLILEIFSRLTNFPNKNICSKKTSPQFHLHLTVLGPIKICSINIILFFKYMPPNIEVPLHQNYVNFFISFSKYWEKILKEKKAIQNCTIGWYQGAMRYRNINIPFFSEISYLGQYGISFYAYVFRGGRFSIFNLENWYVRLYLVNIVMIIFAYICQIRVLRPIYINFPRKTIIDPLYYV